MIQDRDCGDENDAVEKFKLGDVITANDVRAWLRVNGAIKIFGEEAVVSPVTRYDHLLYEYIEKVMKK